jgi:CubicO group peptidase (beta-lactamase class C family)
MATAVADEITRGQLRLDDRLADHWSGLPGFMPEVQIDHLVYMTSGVPEYFTLPSPRGGWSSEHQFTIRDILSAVFDAGQLTFKPSTRWAYNNSNYVLLAELVGRTNGRRFSDHMQRRFFRPLGMNSTWVDDRLESRAGAARSYITGLAGLGWQPVPRRSPYYGYGGSGIFSTLADLALWDAALYRDEVFGSRLAALVVSTRRFRIANETRELT